jgi:glycine/D-amino acid oxidase-like deaminating enzyme/nitrite reductase/ring-hydroxylating ferredoxin subunit
MAGLTTAYLLIQAGCSVVVLEDGALGGSATARTTAHLSNAIDARYVEIEKLHGEEGARLTAESHTAAIAEIEAIIRRERIDCDFARVDGFLFSTAEGGSELLEKELSAARSAGLKDVTLVRKPPLPFLDGHPCLRFPRQAQFHPLKYLAGLSEAITRGGGRIFTSTHADHIEGGSGAVVKAGPHLVSAGAVVVATGTPVNDLVVIHTKQAPYMSYVVGIRVPRGAVPAGLYWDTEDPYHYVRVQPMKGDFPSHDLLIVGGEDHKTGQADDTELRHDRLLNWTRERFPMAGSAAFQWSGQVMESIDGLAFIGRNPMDKDNVFIATGDSGMGMTHGTIAGLVLTDLIQGRNNPWATLYDPSRKTLRAAGTFVKETANVSAQYADWIKPVHDPAVDHIAKDSGAVIRRGVKRLAVYRDQDGKLHEHSAACPHLGCVVGWNPSEKTWDCPCHGSRFDPLGKVLNGPANRDLAE